MHLRDGGVRSVMNSYAEIDGMPVAATPAYLTELLRVHGGNLAQAAAGLARFRFWNV